MNESPKESFLARCGDTPRDARNQKRLLWCFVGWAVTFAGASQLIKRGLLPEGPVVWAFAALPAIAGVVVLWAYARYLREADELHRQIQLNALALGFGVTFFAIGAYDVFEKAGAPQVQPDDYTFVMAAFYTLGLVLGWRKYR